MTKPGELGTTRRPKLELPPGSPSPFVLTVVEGPDAGLVHTVDPAGASRVLVGKSPACMLHLNDPEVSRRHASLQIQGAHLQVLDLGSTNGTTVNGVLVKEVYLLGGEAIRMGQTVLSVKRESPKYVAMGQDTSFGRVIGESRAMRKLYPALKKLAATDRPVLLEGEPGTGKELLAEEIHRASPRAAGPFLTLSASQLPTSEIEETLLGESGLLAQAKGGTLFVDEVGHLPLEVQKKLHKSVVGSKSELDPAARATTVRLVCATHSILDSEAFQESFDQTFFFELVPGRIELPPLRERDGDVPKLAKHFWKEIAASDEPLPEDFLPRFEHYSWPGNVRELASAVAQRHLQGELGTAFKADVPAVKNADYITQVTDQDLPFPRARELVVYEFEKRYVEKVLARHGGSVAKAAVASGVAHRYFQLIRARLK